MLTSLTLALAALSAQPSANALKSSEIVTILRSTFCVAELFDLKTFGSVGEAPVKALNEEGLQLFGFYSKGPVQPCLEELIPQIPGSKINIGIQNSGVIAAPIQD